MAKQKTPKATVTSITKNKRRAEDKTTQLKIRVESSEGDGLYSNYMEVGHSQYEFMLTVARLPTKLGASALALAKERGEVVIEPQVQILFSPKIVAGLIKALTTELGKYETRFGKITSTGDHQIG